MTYMRYRKKKKVTQTAQVDSARQFREGERVNVLDAAGKLLCSATVGKGGTLHFALPVEVEVNGMIYMERAA